MNLNLLRSVARRRYLAPSLALCSFFTLTAFQWPPEFEFLELESDRSQENYELCATQMLDRDLDSDTIALACATTYKPVELSSCVSQIDDATEITATEALSYCREVRRPLDLSDCTVRIDAKFIPEQPLKVIDTCFRTLLPVEFANCSIGLENQIPMGLDQAMATCIDSTDRVRDIFPTPTPAVH